MDDKIATLSRDASPDFIYVIFRDVSPDLFQAKIWLNLWICPGMLFFSVYVYNKSATAEINSSKIRLKRMFKLMVIFFIRISMFGISKPHPKDIGIGTIHYLLVFRCYPLFWSCRFILCYIHDHKSLHPCCICK